MRISYNTMELSITKIIIWNFDTLIARITNAWPFINYSSCWTGPPIWFILFLNQGLSSIIIEKYLRLRSASLCKHKSDSSIVEDQQEQSEDMCHSPHITPPYTKERQATDAHYLIIDGIFSLQCLIAIIKFSHSKSCQSVKLHLSVFPRRNLLTPV